MRDTGAIPVETTFYLTFFLLFDVLGGDGKMGYMAYLKMARAARERESKNTKSQIHKPRETDEEHAHFSKE